MTTIYERMLVGDTGISGTSGSRMTQLGLSVVFFLVGGRGTVSDGMNSTRLKNRLNGMMTLTTITTTLTLTSLLVLPCIYSLEQRISTLRGLPVWDVVNI